MKLIGKLEDGTVFMNKGHNDAPFEFKIDEGQYHLNNAACKLKLKDYKQTIKLCTKVLDSDSKNVKALYRRAQVYIQLVDLDLAEMDIRKALEIDPKNR